MIGPWWLHSRKSVAVNSNFIKAKTKGLDDIDRDWRHKLRLLATRIAGSCSP